MYLRCETMLVGTYIVIIMNIELSVFAFDGQPLSLAFNDSESKLHLEDGRIAFPNPIDSIVSLPEIPPYPEPLHEWYASAQVSETLQAFDRHLSQYWIKRVNELPESTL